MMFISRFGCCSLGRSGENNPLESRGVRVLTKCRIRQIEIVATQAIQKVDKRFGKNFSLQQGIGEEQQSDSNTNYTDWSDAQAISAKDNQHIMANKRSLGMR